jgi:hypothetical protein
MGNASPVGVLYHTNDAGCADAVRVPFSRTAAQICAFRCVKKSVSVDRMSVCDTVKIYSLDGTVPCTLASHPHVQYKDTETCGAGFNVVYPL